MFPRLGSRESCCCGRACAGCVCTRVSVLPRVSLGVERLVTWRGAVLEAPGRWPAAALLCVPAAACAGSGFSPTSRHAVVFLMTAVFVAVKRRLAVHYRLEP